MYLNEVSGGDFGCLGYPLVCHDEAWEVDAWGWRSEELADGAYDLEYAYDA